MWAMFVNCEKVKFLVIQKFKERHFIRLFKQLELSLLEKNIQGKLILLFQCCNVCLTPLPCKNNPSIFK